MLTAGVALAIALGGCAGQPGTAAVVDGERISQAQVEAVHTDLVEVFQGVTGPQVLQSLIIAPFVLDAAQAEGVAVSDEQARTFLQDTATQAGADAGTEFSDASVELLRSDLSLQGIQSLGNAAEVMAGIETAIAEADVELSPRYGSGFDLAGGGIAPLATPWIVPTAS